MPPKLEPFVSGPTRPKQVISLGFYRTGSQSLKEALTILGYRDVFHSSAIAKHPEKWPALEAAADNNVACLPSYTGRDYSREDWDALFGPCEALTDVTPLADSLLLAYPEARVILVHRDFDAWAESFLRTLVRPSTHGLLAWFSGNWGEPLLGLNISRAAWKMYMGLLGVSRMDKLEDRRVMRAGYERHYRFVRRAVPPERLLELDLKDLDWAPLCKFLGKEVPDQPFPRANESRVYSNAFRDMHWKVLQGSLIKLFVPVAVAGAVAWAGVWIARSRGGA